MSQQYYPQQAPQQPFPQQFPQQQPIQPAQPYDPYGIHQQPQQPPQQPPTQQPPPIIQPERLPAGKDPRVWVAMLLAIPLYFYFQIIIGITVRENNSVDDEIIFLLWTGFVILLSAVGYGFLIMCNLINVSEYISIYTLPKKIVIPSATRFRTSLRCVVSLFAMFSNLVLALAALYLLLNEYEPESGDHGIAAIATILLGIGLIFHSIIAIVGLFAFRIDLASWVEHQRYHQITSGQRTIADLQLTPRQQDNLQSPVQIILQPAVQPIVQPVLPQPVIQQQQQQPFQPQQPLQQQRVIQQQPQQQQQYGGYNTFQQQPQPQQSNLYQPQYDIESPPSGYNPYNVNSQYGGYKQ